jgi:hypothetical protein
MSFPQKEENIMYNGKTITLMIALALSANGFALSTLDLSQGTTPANLVANFIDTSTSNITYSNIKYTGANSAAGLFTDGIVDGLGIEKGIILSTGRISNAVGPNKCYKTTAVQDQEGDANLDAFGSPTHDAAVLEFDFVPEGDLLEFNYVFASEEYIEWVGSKFNDVFGFFLDGENIALIPNTKTPVAINSIHSTPWGYEANPELYRDNNYPFPWDIDAYNTKPCQPGSATSFKTEFDGFTTVLRVSASVTPNQSHHLKLVIADRGDYSLDSAVFLQGRSFTTLTMTCKLCAVNDEGLNDSQIFMVAKDGTSMKGNKHVGYDIEALDAHPSEGKLYAGSGKDAKSNAGLLYLVDCSTGELTPLNFISFDNGNQIKDISGLSFNPNTNSLCGWAQGQGLFCVELPDTNAQLKMHSTDKIEDLTWNQEGTELYLARKNQLLRYNGTGDPTLLCSLAGGRKIEALETTTEGLLLIGIDGDNIIYKLDLANISNEAICPIEPFETLATSYKDIEGIAQICTIQ